MISNDSDFETKISLQNDATAIPDDDPFRLLFLGDWSGRESRSNQLDTFKSYPIEIDRDNFEDVFQKLDVRLDLEFSNDSTGLLSLNFSKLDDFHPDFIFQQVPMFAELRDLRRKLLKSETFEKAATEIRSWFISDDVSTNKITETRNINESNEVFSDNLLDQILSQTDHKQASSPKSSVASTELSAFIKEIVQPHLVKTDQTEQSKLLGVIDEVTSDFMRKIIHHPHFKALESAWRGLYFIVRGIETDTNLKIFIADICKSEISEDLRNVTDLTDSILYKWLFKEASEVYGDEPWAIVCGNYNFAVNLEDIAALIRFGKIASVANAPFVSHIRPDMFGIKSLFEQSDPNFWNSDSNAVEVKLWETLRNQPESSFLGMLIPRFLIRLPFGQATEPTETFSFEELSEDGNHDQFLWCNPSFLCGLLFARSFTQSGWDLNNAFISQIDGLPTHFYDVEGEAKVTPSCEVVLNEKACNMLLEQGLMALLSHRNSDLVKLSRLQSIAFPLQNLSGRWHK